MKNRNIIIKNALIITSCSGKPYDYLDVKVASISINNGIINTIGPYEDEEMNLNSDGEEIDCENGQYIAMPGFVNAHNHSRLMALQAFPDSGFGNPASLPRGTTEMSNIFRWFLLDTLKAGITFVCDWPEHPNLWDPKPLDKVLQEMRLRSCIRVLISHDRKGPLPNPRKAAEYLHQTFERLSEAVEQHMIQLGIWIPEEDKPEFTRPVLRFLGNLQWCMNPHEPLFFQMHLAETEKRKKACEKALDKLVWEGLIKSSSIARTIFIHAIWIDERDLSILTEKKNQVGVVTCPKFSDGRIAPIKELLSAGIPVALGSDVSSPDPFALIRTVVSLHRSREESKRISIGEAFNMATLGGARVFGLQNQIGSIEKGKSADIVLVRNPAAVDFKIFSESDDKKKIEAIGQLFSRNVIRKEHVDTVIIRGKKIISKSFTSIVPSIDGINEKEIEYTGRETALAIMERFRKSLSI